ncbi:hypothetical protein ACIBI9_19545 [Nonomuraea sp. NPDC050451]|uniref:hypothetical protein n=1 Tax=Nonomuraea sp. NPDC050451 TaxID=3364364 RepID=UPI0037B2F4C5
MLRPTLLPTLAGRTTAFDRETSIHAGLRANCLMGGEQVRERGDDSGRGEIMLRHGPHQPDITISLAGLHHLSIDKPPESSGCFLDEASVVHLPASPAPWPDGFDGVRRHPGLPELAWIRLIGPMEIEIVASLLTVFSALSDDAARTRPNL